MEGKNRRLFLFVFSTFFFFPIFSRLSFAGGQLLEDAGGGKSVARSWAANPMVRWRYSTDHAPSGIQPILQQCFQTWEQQSLASVSDQYIGTTSNTSPQKDGFSDIYFNVSLTSLGLPSGVIAITLLNSQIPGGSSGDGSISEADILVNPSYNSQLTTTPPTDPTQLDVQEVLTHEIGHLFGLSHSFLIDSVMFPAKPDPSSATAEEKSLFRVPKRTLAQDDAAQLESIYKPATVDQQTSEIGGHVEFNHNDYVGAHVVALKTDETDLAFKLYPAASPEALIVKGMQNVSVFSSGGGNFLMNGLKPGPYRILTQDSEHFYKFTLANVGSYLADNATQDIFPTQFWDSPDCAQAGVVTTNASITSSYAASGGFSIAAGQAVCDVKIVAHTGQNYCGPAPIGADRCSPDGSVSGSGGGGGGCALMIHSDLNLSNHPGFVFLILGGVIVIFFARRNAKKIRRQKNTPDKNSSEPWI